MRSHFATAIVALFAAPAAHASLIDVQFGFNGSGPPTTINYVGAGVLGGAVDQWNEFLGPFSSSSPVSNLALNDVTGAATGVTLSYAGQSGFNNAINSVFSPLMGGTSYAHLLDSYMYATGSATLTLSGLTPGGAYDLVIYAITNVNGHESKFTVGGTTQSVIAAATPGLTAGKTYAEFANAIADGSGHIVVTTAAGNTPPGTNAEADINGFQITEAAALPEPGTAALLLAGTAVLGWRRSRRGRNA